jgi:hypothetical protein
MGRLLVEMVEKGQANVGRRLDSYHIPSMATGCVLGPRSFSPQHIASPGSGARVSINSSPNQPSPSSSSAVGLSGGATKRFLFNSASTFAVQVPENDGAAGAWISSTRGRGNGVSAWSRLGTPVSFRRCQWFLALLTMHPSSSGFSCVWVGGPPGEAHGSFVGCPVQLLDSVLRGHTPCQDLTRAEQPFHHWDIVGRPSPTVRVMMPLGGRWNHQPQQPQQPQPQRLTSHAPIAATNPRLPSQARWAASVCIGARNWADNV